MTDPHDRGDEQRDVLNAAFAIGPVLGDSATRARAYGDARRHSARVRALRILLPTGAVLALAVVVGVSRLNPFGRIPGLTLGPVTMSGSKVAMESPRLTGFRKDSQPYEVTATAAYQDIRKPTVIELKTMRARLAIDDAGTMARLSSAMGVFDTSKEQLELSEDIRITTDRGEEVSMRSASIDFKAGTVVSRDPVRITLSAGTVEAEGLQVADGGRTISFTGRVRTRLETGGPATDPGPKEARVAQPKTARPPVGGPEASVPAPGRGASSPPPRITQRALPNERKP